MTVDKSCFIAPGAQVMGDVTLGAGSSVWHNAVLRGDEAPIKVGAMSNIQDCTVVHCSHEYPVTIGDYVTIGHGAIIHGCTIEDGCLIGMGAILLNGSHIQAGAIVAAGALVTEGAVVPAGMMAMGSPAKVKRPLRQDEVEGNCKSAIAYVQEAQGHLNGKFPCHPTN